MKQSKYYKERENINAWFRLPRYRIWKYLIIGDASAIVSLVLATIIWMDRLEWQTVMIMRGCAGVLGAILAVLLATYYYLVYRDYIRDRFTPRNKK